MKTRSYKLQDKIGHKVECDFCLEKKVFTDKWLETGDRETKDVFIACPDCVEEHPEKCWGSI